MASKKRAISDVDILPDPKDEDPQKQSRLDPSLSPLARVSSNPNVSIDHGALDEIVIEEFTSDRRHNEEPSWHVVLSSITDQDERLVALTPRGAEELLERQPSIHALLQKPGKKVHSRKCDN